MPGRGISGMVDFARQVFDAEAAGKGVLFESVQPRIGYLIQCSVEDFDQGFVISNDNKIVAILGEVAGFFKAPEDSQGFTFDGHIALFRRAQELGSGLEYQRGSCSVAGGGSSLCHTWTSLDEGRCVYACQRSPHPYRWHA